MVTILSCVVLLIADADRGGIVYDVLPRVREDLPILHVKLEEKASEGLGRKLGDGLLLVRFILPDENLSAEATFLEDLYDDRASYGLRPQSVEHARERDGFAD